MNKDNKNGIKENKKPKKAKKAKKATKKDLELIIKSLEDKNLRLQAEFDNFRKRKDVEISNLLKYEGKSFILDFLSILDNINRGIESYKDEDTKKALSIVKNDLLKKFNSREIKAFGESGDDFDPELHEALTTKNDKKMEDNKIVEVYESGYMYKDIILRHAKVVVNKK